MTNRVEKTVFARHVKQTDRINLGGNVIEILLVDNDTPGITKLHYSVTPTVTAELSISQDDHVTVLRKFEFDERYVVTRALLAIDSINYPSQLREISEEINTGVCSLFSSELYAQSGRFLGVLDAFGFKVVKSQ